METKPEKEVRFLKFHTVVAALFLRCFVFGAVFIGLFCSSIAAQEKKSSQEIPTVAFCDLVKNAALYEGKIVRVKASYYVQFEISEMSDASCDQTAWVDLHRDIEKSTEPKLWKRFVNWSGVSRTMKSDCVTYSRRKFLVTWIGVFEAAKPIVETEEQTIMQNFGHMDEYDFQFTAQKVEAISNLESNNVKICK